MLCNMYADAIRLSSSILPQRSPNRRTAPSPQMEILLPALDESIMSTAQNTVFWLMSRLDAMHEGRTPAPIGTENNWREQRNYSLNLIKDDFQTLKNNTALARDAFVQAVSRHDYRFSNMDLAHTQFTQLCTDTSAHFDTVYTLLNTNSVLGVSPPTATHQRIIDTAFTNIEKKIQADKNNQSHAATPQSSSPDEVICGVLHTIVDKSLAHARKLMQPRAADGNIAPILLAGPVLTQLKIYQQPDLLKAGLTACDTPEQMLCNEVAVIVSTIKTHIERDHYHDLVLDTASKMSADAAHTSPTQRTQIYNQAKHQIVHTMDGALDILAQQVNSLSHLTKLGHRYFNTPNRLPYPLNTSRYLS